MNDADALDWLDRLLDLEPAERSARLQRLTGNGLTFQARLARLLSTALEPDESGVLGWSSGGSSEAFGIPRALLARPDQSIAGYRLVRELGQGGMAAVWLAVHSEAGVEERVAIKLPLFSVRTALGARFLRERELLAGLRHPHIARLYETGIVDGQPFMVLEYVEGVAITEYCDRERLDIRGRLRLFLQVLDAVGHAHRRSIVHRDLKPPNILVSAAGQVKLLDFGISKLLADRSAACGQLTQLGDAVMTPSYAAPEQANGGEVTALTDIFVLGVLLHQLLTGTLPYARACGKHPTLGSVIDALLRSPPTLPSEACLNKAAAAARGVASPRELRGLLQGDLDAIVDRAMQFDPARRYASTQEMAEHVRALLAKPH